jgi:hypothetical protein
MNKLYLVHNNQQWQWMNDQFVSLSPTFANQTDARNWRKQIVQYMEKPAVSTNGKKISKLCQVPVRG